jgi:two-component system, response regulator
MGEISAAEARDGFVLYVDDMPMNAELFIEAMRMHGYRQEVVVVRDGVECLDHLFGEGPYEGRDPNEAPRLILLDLHMPHMDGFETLWRIREDKRTRHLPVVMFSAMSFPEDIATAYRLGANAFIDRSSVAAPFPELVKQVARFWLVTNEPPPASRAPTDAIHPTSRLNPPGLA